MRTLINHGATCVSQHEFIRLDQLVCFAATAVETPGGTYVTLARDATYGV